MDEWFKIHEELKHLPHLLGTHSFLLRPFDFKGYLQVTDVDPKGDQLQQLLLLVNRVTFLYNATIFPFGLFTPSNIQKSILLAPIQNISWMLKLS